ncbi:MAG: shikimate dehydrogenase [Gammaproteobacteria bacterium]|jgi:shikimate dehydrogenase|nr:shikimate dehydrogenase [Chromatiales bacterium]MCP4924378.1 shikimate dehydrogenase [Gammaproteobacteria bacterium]MDP7153164.1 shikimate dehydrogenase [Gammaproteobacteria bacterium]MDP7295822.1 shikimate dehydrogenase [Gammaproteobacteria bacterium]MDP7419417.1 shikimate dehydrogenase [Gammaproteobacteria bacterium]
MTDRYGVIGHPIAHSKSPVIHQQFASQTMQELSYEAIDIAPDNLAKKLNTLIDSGVKGLNVTVPHKNAIANLVDELSERAELAGAVNTISIDRHGGVVGDNTDGVGLYRDLTDNLDIQLADRNLLILGAGGATRGIIPVLLDAQPARLCIANRTVQKAVDLAEQFVALGAITPCRFDDLHGLHFDLIINATSAGLTGEVPPFPGSVIDASTVCYDLSYSMTDTPFCIWAQQQGAAETHQGWGMLVEQAAESFLIWHGVRPDTRPVRALLPA